MGVWMLAIVARGRGEAVRLEGVVLGGRWFKCCVNRLQAILSMRAC